MDPLLIGGGALALIAIAKKGNSNVISKLPANKQANGEWYLQNVTFWINDAVNYAGIMNMLATSGVDVTAQWVREHFDMMASTITEEALPNWFLTDAEEFNIVKAVVQGLHPTPNNTPTPNPAQSSAHNKIQGLINQFMADPVALNNLDYLKVGGSKGTKPNLKTAMAFIFAWAVGAAGVAPPDSYTSYIYPNINAHVDPNATDGLGRGPNGGGLFSAATIQTIIKYAPAILAVL